MHRMTKWVLAAAMACVLGTGAVAVAEDSYYLELPTKGITASRKITVNVPDENPAQDGINPLTGESWYGNYYPILVNIDAHPGALPHWGVASADISYEMPIQSDGSTRSACLLYTSYGRSFIVGVEPLERISPCSLTTPALMPVPPRSTPIYIIYMPPHSVD